MWIDLRKEQALNESARMREGEILSLYTFYYLLYKDLRPSQDNLYRETSQALISHNINLIPRRRSQNEFL